MLHDSLTKKKIKALDKISSDEVPTIPDEVFDPEYNLESLANVAKFIKRNKHLKGIPHMDEVEEWRELLLSRESTMLLLMKIEEIILYLIKHDTRLNRHSRRLKDLEALAEELGAENISDSIIAGEDLPESAAID